MSPRISPSTKRSKKGKHKLLLDRVTAVQRRYWRVPELAAELGISPHTVWKWIREGLLPSVRIGGAILLERDQVTRLIEERYTRNVVKV